MDFNRDGSRFLILTYVNAFEFYIDLSEGGFPVTDDLVEGTDFHEIPLELLIQQESIAYLGETAFLLQYGSRRWHGPHHARSLPPLIWLDV